MQIQKGYQVIVDRIKYMDVRRRYYTDLIRSGARVINNEGWKSFIFKVKKWFKAQQRTKIHFVQSPDYWDDYIKLKQKIYELKEKKLKANKSISPKMISIDENRIDSCTASLNFTTNEKPLVSIIIQICNNGKLFIECLSSILQNTKRIDYEVIVIDESCDGNNKELLSKVRNITYLKNNEDNNFLEFYNRAVEGAHGEYILLLDGCTQVTENWLNSLLKTFSKIGNVGAVGPKIISTDGRLKDAGAHVKKDATIQMIGFHDDARLNRYNYYREVEYCPIICLLLKKEIYKKIGGFDRNLTLDYGVDIDLCFRIHISGMQVIYNPDAVIIHNVIEYPESDKKRQLISHNQQLISEKWQEQIDIHNRVRMIAFYLPQYYPIPENDLWWGTGFTEWTNVTRAQPNYVNHYQPHLPSDLGYYDLRVEHVMEKQSELAKRYGIYGFCFHYYWFHGKRLLEMPLERMIKTNKPDIPFCLCWANDNWTRSWVQGSESQILIGQQHSEEDDVAVIHDIMRYMKNENYIKINGKPLLLIYRADLFPDIRRTTDIWRNLCLKAGIGDIYLVMVESFADIYLSIEEVNPVQYGFDASLESPPHLMYAPIKPPGKMLNQNYKGIVHDYRELVLNLVQREIPGYTRFRSVLPGWDDTPRRQNNSNILEYSSPGAYQIWMEAMIDLAIEQNFGDERIVFINAWNEWAEGMHLEPDRRFGHGYLEATRNAIDYSLLSNDYKSK